ncbi:MAG: uroporphyrinogen decarboxylase family protein [Actinomycetota bacterium]
MKSKPLDKKEVIKAIKKNNPRYIPGWYRWIADETWNKYGSRLGELLKDYLDDIVLVNYDTPKGFVESAPGRDEFYIYYINKPGVFSGYRTSDIKNDWKKAEGLIHNPPDPYAKGRFENAIKMRKKYPDRYLAGHWWATFFEKMIAIRGEENLLTDIYLERKKVEALGWMICDFLCGIVDGFAETGMDGIFFSDDLGFSDQLIFRPDIFRDIWKPWYKKLFARIRSYNMNVIMHSCGYLWEIIPDLIDCGLEVLHFQPSALDPVRLVREYGKYLTFFGGIDIQRFLIDSTPEGIETGIRDIYIMLDHDGGGYIAGPSNSIMPDTPFENIEAMLYSMKKYSDRRIINKLE